MLYQHSVFKQSRYMSFCLENEIKSRIEIKFSISLQSVTETGDRVIKLSVVFSDVIISRHPVSLLERVSIYIYYSPILSVHYSLFYEGRSPEHLASATNRRNIYFRISKGERTVYRAISLMLYWTDIG
jgi:hypothetical protein